MWRSEGFPLVFNLEMGSAVVSWWFAFDFVLVITVVSPVMIWFESLGWFSM